LKDKIKDKIKEKKAGKGKGGKWKLKVVAFFKGVKAALTELNPDFEMDGEIVKSCLESAKKLPLFKLCVKKKAEEKFSPE